jgi:Ca-activated chloride channel family protein
VVFVIDCSGSMDGQSIEEARNALQLCLSSLTPDQRFEIVSFGSTHRRLFGASRPYDEASLAGARAHVAGLGADLGGTEILPALADVLTQPPVPGLPRQLLILTDGQVTNTDEVIALVRRHSGDTRVFAFGIGAGVDSQLVKGLARAGEGAAEFIEPGERVEAKVLRQLERLLTPGLGDLRVEWYGATVRQAPHYVPPVFADGRVIVYGLGEGAPPATAVLRARGPAGEVEWHLPIDGQAAGEGTLLGTLAARTLICDLEEGMSPLHDRRGSLQRRGRSAESRVEQEIVKLAKAWSLASRHTSFVAVERRETPAEGEAVLRRVPLALQRGWGGRDVQFCRPAMPLLTACSLERSESVDELCMDVAESPRATARRLRAAPAAPVSASRPAHRPLDKLVALQRFDGSWDLTDELAQFFGQQLGVLLALIDAQDHRARKALATALALTWLHAEAEADEDEWALLAAKAEAWLDACGVAAPGEGWLELAASFVRPRSG